MSSSLEEAVRKCDEWFISVLLMMTPVETLRYAATSKTCLSFVQNNNSLWIVYVTALLGGEYKDDRMVKDLISLLQVPSPQEFCRCLYRSSGNVRSSGFVGWYRIVPQGHVLKKGGLICIQEHPRKKIEMLFIGANGHVETTYDMLYSATIRQLVCCHPDDHECEVYQLMFANLESGMQLSLIDENDGASLTEGQHAEMTLQPFLMTIEFLTYENPDSGISAAVGSITGLFTAPYGSHGLELLHVRLVESMQLSRWENTVTSTHRSNNIDDDIDDTLATDEGDDDDGGGVGTASVVMTMDGEFSDEESEGNVDDDDDDDDDDEDVQFFDAQEGTQGELLDGSGTSADDAASSGGGSGGSGIESNESEQHMNTGMGSGADSTFFIEGLKITGDLNVPAGRLSFRVDVTRPMDFLSWIVEDPRPIVLFGEDGDVSAIMMNDRQSNVRAAYRGFGQINRKPEEWNPELVALTLVLYSSTDIYGAFSIVWDDDGDYFRHLIDFRPFLTPDVCHHPPA